MYCMHDLIGVYSMHARHGVRHMMYPTQLACWGGIPTWRNAKHVKWGVVLIERPPPFDSMLSVWSIVSIGSWINRIYLIFVLLFLLCICNRFIINIVPIVDFALPSVVVDFVEFTWYRSKSGDLELRPYQDEWPPPPSTEETWATKKHCSLTIEIDS